MDKIKSYHYLSEFVASWANIIKKHFIRSQRIFYGMMDLCWINFLKFNSMSQLLNYLHPQSCLCKRNIYNIKTILKMLSENIAELKIKKNIARFLSTSQESKIEIFFKQISLRWNRLDIFHIIYHLHFIAIFLVIFLTANRLKNGLTT